MNKSHLKANLHSAETSHAAAGSVDEAACTNAISPESQIHPPVLPDEEDRISALNRYEILDSLPEQAYDDIALLASQICGAPIALVTLIDRDRQWFKSVLGLDIRQTPREYAFCAYAIAKPDDVTIVNDARRDIRFQNNPLVTGETNIGFYAGAPLITPDGHALGTLCVIDHMPRNLSPAQHDALEALSRQVMAQLELRLKMRELNRSEQRFQDFMNNSPALTYIKDMQGRYVYMNEPFLQRFGIDASETGKKTDHEMWPPHVVQRVREGEQKVLAGGQAVSSDQVMNDSNGETTHWLVYKFPLYQGNEIFLGGIAIDITQSKRYEQQLEATQRELEAANALLAVQSTTDVLTGVQNRRAFDARLEIEWQRARRQRTPLSLLLLDIDRFKGINDSFGHQAGDGVLQQAAQLLKNTARTTDVVSRFGGEEFAVISPDTTTQGAQILAERFRLAIQDAAWELRAITISIGAATIDFSGDVPEISDTSQLIEAADRALYAAKEGGRNRVETSTL